MQAAARDRFERVCAVVAAALPGRLGEVVAPTMVGFVVINGFTFGVDLLLVMLLHGGLHRPLWLAVALAYTLAFTLSFLLNRALNFRSHRPVGRQLAIWLVVVVVNYVGVVIGVTTGLAALGVVVPVARTSAGVVEAAFMYAAMRWVVFRDRPALRRRPRA